MGINGQIKCTLRLLAAQDFQEEIETLGMLRHPNVVLFLGAISHNLLEPLWVVFLLLLLPLQVWPSLELQPSIQQYPGRFRFRRTGQTGSGPAGMPATPQ